MGIRVSTFWRKVYALKSKGAVSISWGIWKRWPWKMHSGMGENLLILSEVEVQTTTIIVLPQHYDPFLVDANNRRIWGDLRCIPQGKHFIPPWAVYTWFAASKDNESSPLWSWRVNSYLKAQQGTFLKDTYGDSCIDWPRRKSGKHVNVLAFIDYGVMRFHSTRDFVDYVAMSAFTR